MYGFVHRILSSAATAITLGFPFEPDRMVTTLHDAIGHRRLE